MQRPCPNCSENTVPVAAILFSSYRCPNCRCVVGISRVPAAIVNALILIAAIITTGMVFLQAGLYAAIVWLPFPVGALSYLKARFCRLQVHAQGRDGP